MSAQPGFASHHHHHCSLKLTFPVTLGLGPAVLWRGAEDTELTMVNRFGGKIKFVITSGCFGSSIKAAASPASCWSGLAWESPAPHCLEGEGQAKVTRSGYKTWVQSLQWSLWSLMAQSVASLLVSPFLFYSLSRIIHRAPRVESHLTT